MRDVWLALAVLGFGYYAVIAVYAGPDADFSWFWIVLGTAGLVLFGRDCLAAGRPGLFPELLHRVYVCLLCAGLAVLAAFCVPVLSRMRLPDPEDADYLIVLGAQVKGTKPLRALRRRLDKAVSLAGKIPSAVLILSGGQGSGEEISEAECMRRYLSGRGIPERRMILENRSTTTWENLVFSDRLTGCAAGRSAVVTNDFHVCRALLLAKSAGYTDVCGAAAPGDPVMELHYVVREGAALAVRTVRRLADG